MKNLTTTLLFLALANYTIGQMSGNVNYNNKIQNHNASFVLNAPNETRIITSYSDKIITLTAKGMTNLEADSYVAIFSLTQIGKTTEEVNTLITEKITKAINEVKLNKKVNTFVDMVSFVPKYDYQMEQKRLFNKKTYNEIPTGFELKKNIHIEFFNQSDINDILTVFAQQEIYDLVRVDYYSTKMESVRKELMQKAKTILDIKTKNQEALMDEKFDSLKKYVVDGYKVVLPIEKYSSFQSYSSSSLESSKSVVVNATDKNTTLYYKPILDTEFDFVTNPIVLEPVIQVMYEVKLVIYLKDEPAEKPLVINKIEKEYILITPNGTIKTITD